MIIDSCLTYEEATRDNPKVEPAPLFVRKYLRLIKVWYYSYDGEIHEGQLVVHRHIRPQVKAIFGELLRHRIPIAKVVPIVSYEWDDERSMQDNATSCYNWRTIPGTDRLSLHALGLAIDINPLWNPWIKGELVQPAGARYDPSVPGTLTANSLIVQIFKKYGFDWAGDWYQEHGLVDYQHFGFLPRLADPLLYLREHNLM